MTPYVYERQSEYWTSHQIVQYFFDEGFEVFPFPLTQIDEKLLPADFIFFNKNKCKLFGIQYKALYKNSEDFWKIDETQNQQINQNNLHWIYYGLSEVRKTSELRSALHLARFVKAIELNNLDRFYVSGYKNKVSVHWNRWIGFHQRLENCLEGIKITSESQIRDEITRLQNSQRKLERLADDIIDLFLCDFDQRKVVFYS